MFQDVVVVFERMLHVLTAISATMPFYIGVLWRLCWRSFIHHYSASRQRRARQYLYFLRLHYRRPFVADFEIQTIVFSYLIIFGLFGPSLSFINLKTTKC